MRFRLFHVVWLLLLMPMAAVCYSRQQGPDIDWNRARALHQRVQRGERLGADDQAYYERAKREFERRNGNGGQVQPARESIGLTPLTDVRQSAYRGESGGLYGEGRNEPPAAHLRAAMRESAKIRPLDAQGRPGLDGRIVLLSIGMSNTTQEFSQFQRLAERDSQRSPSVVIVDGAQGGQAAEQWLDPNADRSPWKVADQRLQSAGVTQRQVQAVWIKQALIQQGQYGEFPDHARRLEADLVKIVQIAKERFPNLRLAYLSSRIYAGYATTALNPEPYAYEGAFSVRWVIQKQIAGDAMLNYDPAKGPVKAPIALWGPYLWADGVKGRKTDALVWNRPDFAGDGTHPSDSGRQKVADQLLRFFKTEPTARGWFLNAATQAAGGPTSRTR